MSATLLAELEAVGIHIIREGDTLRVRGTSGVNPAPYREHITAHKPALMVALQARETIATLTDELERGWRWMETHRAHPEHEAFWERWVAKLHAYGQACRAAEWRLPTEADPTEAATVRTAVPRPGSGWTKPPTCSPLYIQKRSS